MPELPDVEGFKRVLAGNALRKTIDRVEVSDARILGKLSARTFASRLRGARLVAAHRHGKHLMARIDRGGWLTLHFGLTGALQFVQSRADEPPFTRVRLDSGRASIRPRGWTSSRRGSSAACFGQCVRPSRQREALSFPSAAREAVVPAAGRC